LKETIMLRFLSSVLCLAVPFTVLADDAPDLRSTLTKAARFLQDDMRTWRDDHQCAACHHGPFALWTLSELSRQQIVVDRGYIAELTKWTRTDDMAGLLPKPPAGDAKEKPSASAMSRAVYLSFGVNALSDRTPEVQAMRQRLVQHLQAGQSEDGSWIGPMGRPPVLNPTIEFTLLTAVAWQPHRDEFAELPATLDKAAAWIASQPIGESHQEMALRLMWAAGRKDAVATESLKKRLLSLQQPDGGWRQAADMTSDAFATGQSLVALRNAGVAATDPAIQRGMQFLSRTQADNGSWPMTSRPHPENGTRAGNLIPITYPGAAWGVLGLIATTTK
jgi:hypothetical protein